MVFPYVSLEIYPSLYLYTIILYHCSGIGSERCLSGRALVQNVQSSRSMTRTAKNERKKRSEETMTNTLLCQFPYQGEKKSMW